MSAITLRQIATQLRDGLSHREMLAVTGLTADRLMTWYKRDCLPADFQRAPGRGNWRRYDVDSVITLTMLRVLVDAGLPIEDAACLAPRFSVSPRLMMTTLATPIEAGCELVQNPEPWAAIIRRPEGWQSTSPKEFVSPGFIAVSITSDDTIPIIQKWMRDIGARWMTIIDTSAVEFNLMQTLKRVAAARKAAAKATPK